MEERFKPKGFHIMIEYTLKIFKNFSMILLQNSLKSSPYYYYITAYYWY